MTTPTSKEHNMDEQKEFERALDPKTRTVEMYADSPADARANAESYGYRVRKVERSRKWHVEVYDCTCLQEPGAFCHAHQAVPSPVQA